MVKQIKITDDMLEMVAIGKELFESKQNVYTEKMCNTIMATINANMPGASEEEKQDVFYRAIYDYWVYGNNISEEFYFGFADKSHEEKSKFVTFRNRYLYIHHLNKKENAVLLNDKYKAYQLLKPYYKRDIIQIESEQDYVLFEEFVQKHPVFVAKPVGLGLAIGVHKVDSGDFGSERELFDTLIEEGRTAKAEFAWGTSGAVVLEELIQQHEELARIHPHSVNGIRVTTVRLGDEVHLVHPWFKIGANGNFVTSAAQGTMDATIDAKTGIVDSWGAKENGELVEYHPQTGIRIPGYVIPEWDSLIQTVTEISKILPDINYVGWDMVLTPDKGWCIMEGNFAGEFMWQMCYGKGMKQEFEELIGWKPEKQFWWE